MSATFPSYDGVVLSYTTVGQGPPLLCLPGGPGRAAAYLEDLAGLAERRTLDLLDLLDLRATTPHGASSPCSIGPPGPSCTPGGTSARRHTPRPRTRQVNRRALLGFTDQAGDVDVAALLAGLRSVSAPVLVVAGARDAVTGVESARAVADCFPRACLEVLPRAGHFPWVDEPAAFRSVVGAFLASVLPGTV